MNLSSPLKLLYSDSNTTASLAKHLIDLLSELPSQKPIVICCIGTDRSTGDCLGPLVGSRLRKYAEWGANFHIYGTLDEPVHAMNLSEHIELIHREHHDPFIIAVDASLGQMNSIGCIQIGNGPLKPGAGVNKNLPAIGNIYMTGIVNISGFMEYFVLQNTRLSLVMNMADVIAQSIFASMQRMNVQPFSPTRTSDIQL
ncbi:spore protease YyaC [Paenibacillus sp. N1-5-1-14]|uniref:spore protease YyaC n=1 Tax=Paenibacillus radicibacter TaxID=2972488 RepID=UPI0021590F71|nr:spore protease YyaC [Paenibacillus radicibacter]MCR8642996.1 spore protease YyaC [Paenibacillus radicibacter]